MEYFLLWIAEGTKTTILLMKHKWLCVRISILSMKIMWLLYNRTLPNDLIMKLIKVVSNNALYLTELLDTDQRISHSLAFKLAHKTTKRTFEMLKNQGGGKHDKEIR